MGRPFDKDATIIRNSDLFADLQPIECRLNAQQIAVNPRPTLSELPKNFASWCKIIFKRPCIDQNGSWARIGAVPMQSTEPLQKDVCGARIRYEKIGINIQRLLGCLGCNRYDASPMPLQAEYTEQPLVEPRSILDCIAAM